ncbi:TetR/AcrR family transcriptional regulator [Arthrobacter sp. 260]|uniref:TetR/AcrR family transcriptional regulator n=1 Tax=Arthrobacter sp. 260 TaxID=2735314 RepID=UPI001E55AAC9|nr:TetR/AcrR family transcriptional regulator [Arthrobacter sp. 260]
MGSPYGIVGVMARNVSPYHQQIASQNREDILNAATTLFLDAGYDRTSLAKVAESAGVSKATLFKQFPVKGELFEATVIAACSTPEIELGSPPVNDFFAGLIQIGCAYGEILDRPQIACLMRTIIAEGPRFPELRERAFDFGTLPVLRALRQYLAEVHAAGTAEIDDLEVAATQFLGMIASAVFWPRLVHGTWSISSEERLRAIREAARTTSARYTGTVPL